MQPSFVLKDRSNQELLAGAKHLVGQQRHVTAHLIAHLAEIDSRNLHVVEGFSSLWKYCVGALGLSEDEAYRRAHAALLAQKYPIILDLLLDGSIHLTTLRIIGPCLTEKNHKRVLEAARGKNKTELEHLAVSVCPKPDVPTMLRKWPELRPEPESVQPEGTLFNGERLEDERENGVAAAPNGRPVGADGQPISAGAGEGTGAPDLRENERVASPPPLKSRLAPLSPKRYQLHMTIDAETYQALKELQELLRHRVKNGDLVTIVKDSLLERLEQVKRGKFGKTQRPRKTRQQESWMQEEETKVNSRHIPAEVKRRVWERDQGRCAFVSRSGRRCSERGRLEFHHIHAYALGGPATLENIALRCRTHNAHEGAVLFGGKREGSTRPAASELAGFAGSAASRSGTTRGTSSGTSTAHGTSSGASTP